MLVIMLVMVVAMLSLGQGHFGQMGHMHQAHDQAQSQGHENPRQIDDGPSPEKSSESVIQ